MRPSLLAIRKSDHVTVCYPVPKPRGLLLGADVASRIHGAFEDMGGVQELYMAITAEDSSIVYYKLSKGLVKPQL